MLHRRPLALYALLFGLFLPHLAEAQPPATKGFDVIGQGADTSKKTKGPIVVGRPAEATVVKRWDVRAKGEPANDLMPIVETVELLSNDRMKWNFSMRNNSERNATEYYFDMSNTYLADPEGEMYKPLAREFRDNDPGTHCKSIEAGTKFHFWLEYPAPKEPAMKYKVGMVGHFRGTTQGVRPFNIVLKKEEEPLPDPKNEPVPNALKTVEYKPLLKQIPKPVGTEEQLQTMRNVYEKGMSFTGEMKIGTRPVGKLELVFEPTPEGSPLLARMKLSSNPADEIELLGRVVEDNGSALKTGFVFLAADGTVLRLHLKGDVLEGSDSRGRKFLLKTK